MERYYSKEGNYLRAEKRVKEIKGFYWHLFFYLITCIIWIVIIISLNEEQSFFQYGFWGMGYGLVSMALFWGIGIVYHWFRVFGISFAFSKDWEDKKVKEFMGKDNY